MLRRWRVVGAALPGAVLFAEAGLLAGRFGDPSYESADLAWEGALNVAIGVVVVVLAARGWQLRVIALGAAAPLAVVGVGAFLAAGFG